jgi:hypothetical protein
MTLITKETSRKIATVSIFVSIAHLSVLVLGALGPYIGKKK